MNTTAAAQTAGVTAATIRHWARMGAVAAVKQAGRWIIDAASLARRIAIGSTRSTMDQPKPWDASHPDADLLDAAIAAGIPTSTIVEVSDEFELAIGRRLRNKEADKIANLTRTARLRAGLDTDDEPEQPERATPRQVDYIADLLNQRRRLGDGGGFADEDRYYLPDGRVHMAKIRKMTKQAASGLISSLRQDY